MDELIRRIADAILYEGYVLYPYRPSSTKNRQRFTFGVLHPSSYVAAQRGSDRSMFRCQCLIRGDGRTTIALTVRFLQIATRDGWQVGIEREVDVAPISAGRDIEQPFTFEADARVEGRIACSTREVGSGVFKVSMEVENLTSFEAGDDREAALPYSLASAHAILVISEGEALSLLDPPAGLTSIAATCRNEGVFPVLVGDSARHDAILASPIILYDYPQLAPESPGDLFDATEIDEILSLRIMTMTEAEKREACAADERARELIERTDALEPGQLASLHGAIRSLRK